MKQDDFERLKAICEKEGFELGFKYDECTYTVRKKTDPWEGVEFVECVTHESVNFDFGEIYKRVEGVSIDDRWSIYCKDGKKGSTYGIGGNRKNFKPSTESAYVSQLKKEAFERFGEIKEGDRFDRSSMNFVIPQSITETTSNEGFLYWKEHDQLWKCGICIYNKGKWAERVKEETPKFNVTVDSAGQGRSQVCVSFPNKIIDNFEDVISIVDEIMKGLGQSKK